MANFEIQYVTPDGTTNTTKIQSGNRRNAELMFRSMAQTNGWKDYVFVHASPEKLAGDVARVRVTVRVNGQDGTQTRWLIVQGGSTTKTVRRAINAYIPADVPYQLVSWMKWSNFKKSFGKATRWADYVETGKPVLASEVPFDLSPGPVNTTPATIADPTPTVPTTPQVADTRTRKMVDVRSLLRVGRNVPEHVLEQIVNKWTPQIQADIDTVEQAIARAVGQVVP